MADSELNTAESIIIGFAMLFASVGIISDCFLVRIFKKKDSRIRFNGLMILLGSFDITAGLTFYACVIGFFLKLSKIPLSIILYMDAVARNCSAFTMTAIALERYLVLCKNK